MRHWRTSDRPQKRATAKQPGKLTAARNAYGNNVMWVYCCCVHRIQLLSEWLFVRDRTPGHVFSQAIRPVLIVYFMASVSARASR